MPKEHILLQNIFECFTKIFFSKTVENISFKSSKCQLLLTAVGKSLNLA